LAIEEIDYPHSNEKKKPFPSDTLLLGQEVVGADIMEQNVVVGSAESIGSFSFAIDGPDSLMDQGSKGLGVVGTTGKGRNFFEAQFVN
jgi:hypothetical protein